MSTKSASNAPRKPKSLDEKKSERIGRFTEPAEIMAIVDSKREVTDSDLESIKNLREFAAKVFGDQQKGTHWFYKPRAQFNGKSPSEMAMTEFGRERVKELLGQIESGMFG